MRLLLDSHALLWWLADDSALSSEARRAISDSANVVAVSAATAWEISIKQALGKLVAPDDLEAQVKANGFVAVPITLSDGIAAGKLPRHHSDPLDRMIVAQAKAGEYTVVSRDARLRVYGVNFLTA